MRRVTVDPRMLGAALAAAVAAIVVLTVTRPPATTDVLVATGPVAPGTRLVDVEMGTRAVADPTGLVLADEIEALSDHVLIVGLEDGVPLVRGVLDAPDADAIDVIGIELGSAAGVHGALAPGDRVDVYLEDDPTGPVAADLIVVGVFTDAGALGIGDVGLLLAVDDVLAPTIVAAAASDSIHLVRRGN